MLELKEIQDIIASVHLHVFENPFVFHLGCVLCTREGEKEIPDDDLYCKHLWDHGYDHVLYVQARLWRKDSNTGTYAWGAGSKEFITPHMTPGEVYKRCLVLGLAYGEHEVREGFLVNGVRPFGPHASIESLMAAANQTEVRGEFKPEWTQHAPTT